MASGSYVPCSLVMFWPGMVTAFLDKGSLKHSNAAEVSIPLGGQDGDGKPELFDDRPDENAAENTGG